MSTRVRFTLSAAMAVVALVDNITTWFAVERGAAELNPVVSVFLSSPLLFAAFTAAKTLASFAAVYKAYTKNLIFYAIYAAVLALFIRASIINAFNAVRCR